MMFHQSESADLYHGDVMAVLPTLPAASVQCVVTSPPYFALRSYLPKDDPLKVHEIGSEPTPEAFIQTMVAVFREVRRVLRDDGVCFINLGDSYTTRFFSHDSLRTVSVTNGEWCKEGQRGEFNAQQPPESFDGAKPGDLLNMPHRVAEALRADGWVWRQTVVWAKKSPMPESVAGWRWQRCRVKVAKQGRSNSAGQHYPPELGHAERDRNPDSSRNPELRAQYIPCPGCPKCEPHGGYVLRRGSGRCTTAHEYVFVMAKTGRYFWDSTASAEGAVTGNPTDKSFRANGKSERRVKGVAVPPGATEHSGIDSRESASRNPRTVWTLSSEPTKVRHFATFPSELVRRCLVAGVSAGGCCPHCGAPWAPVVEGATVITGRQGAIRDGGKAAGGRNNTDKGASSWAALYGCGHSDNTVLGYRPTCSCPPHESIGCLVLDPFSGIGTTGQTAIKLGCRYIGIDLNREYLEVAAKRIYEPPRWWLRQQKPKAAPKVLPGQLILFG